MALATGRTIFTATGAYNLAGDFLDRTSFLKSSVAGHFLGPGRDPNVGMADALRESYMNGPRQKLRRFHAWALANYQAIGTPGEIKLRVDQALSTAIKSQIGIPPGDSNYQIQQSLVGPAQYFYWAAQYMLINHIELFPTAWAADIDPVTHDITITFEDLTTETFTPANYDPTTGVLYIYAYYYTQYDPAAPDDSYLRLYIYKIGSGNATLDAIYTQETDTSKAYYPIIPIRLDNKFVNEDPVTPGLEDLVEKALKRSLDTDLKTITDKMEESPDLEDMDYAYITFGASANSSSKHSRKYIFSFLKDLATDPEYDPTNFQQYLIQSSNNLTQFNLFTEYEETPYVEGETHPDPEQYEVVSAPPWQGIAIRAGGTTYDINYDVVIRWQQMTYETGVGLGAPGMEPGDYWWEDLGSSAISSPVYTGDSAVFDESYYNKFRLYHQIDANTWEAVEVIGMTQDSYVFGTHSETLTLEDALSNTEESSFIFPLRHDLFMAMGMKEGSELALESAFLTVHVYEIYIQRFWESLAFRIFLVFAMIAITAATGGFGAAGFGVLGSNAAVGAALGFSGLLATIVGVVANALAAMFITQLINLGAKEVFGDKWGALIGTLTSFVVVGGLTNIAQGGSFFNLAQLANPVVLGKMTTAGVGAYSAALNDETQEILEETEEMVENAETELRRIRRLYAETFGYDRAQLDPMMFIQSDQVIAESATAFLQRTLLTGDDIAEMSMDMIYDYTDITISTALPVD